jgi:hypothetical protein
MMVQDVKRAGKMTAGLGSGVVDSNRFYSMLLDARTVNVTESMHDVAEKLLKGEKDNAKLALDQLWTLTKTLTGDRSDEALDSLISHYQDKINALREREENIKKVSKETRALIDEKRTTDEELAAVKSQITACAREQEELGAKLELLRRREGDLSRAESRLKKEISVNETQIVSGLHDIILRRSERAASDPKDDTKALEFIKQAAAEIQKKAETVEADIGGDRHLGEDVFPFIPDKEERKGKDAANLLYSDDDATIPVNAKAAAARGEPEPFPEPVVYPKSVVRMGGKIIGEYYHDGNVVTKEERHYIYNSRFMAERLSGGLRSVKGGFSQETHAELVKITEDAATRVRENGRFHFEVSTNEILNDKNLRQLGADLRRKAWGDAERFAARLNAKIDTLGSNYEAMLQEQMERCAEIG